MFLSFPQNLWALFSSWLFLASERAKATRIIHLTWRRKKPLGLAGKERGLFGALINGFEKVIMAGNIPAAINRPKRKGRRTF